jgi:hypothetical protein
MNFWKFIQYHNAVPIAIAFIFLGAGGAFAATDPGAVYSSSEQVISIDNSYIVNKDFSTYSPRAEITGVTEDSDTYYVAYNFYTIDLQDGVWQDVTKNEVMKVSKADLGPYRDLGVYVTEQLKQKTDRELDYLKQVQAIESRNVTHKVVATQYGGLVGKFLDTSTEELPGYTPVVTPPAPPPQEVASDQNASTSGQTSASSASSSSGNPSLTVQVLGNDPAQIPLHSVYADLGAVATDAQNDNLRIETYLDGQKVDAIQIDTTATSTHTVRYVALDPENNTATVERTVIVYDPATGPPVPASQVQSSSNSTVPVVTPVTVPTPTPTPTPITTTTTVTVPAPTPAPADTSTTTAIAAPAATSTPDAAATSTPPATTPVDTSASSTPTDTSSTSTAATSTAS